MKITAKRRESFSLWLLGFLGILLLTVFLYRRILNAYFVGEDYEWWTRVRNLNFIGSFRLFLPPQFGGIILSPYFRPLVGWTVWLDTVPFKMSPLAFHLTSLFFHLLNIFLVVFLAFNLLGKKKIIAILAGLFFAIFPFHSEAVVWSVGGRYDVVVSFFYLLALISALQFLRNIQQRWKVATFVFFGLALLCKESAISFPIILVFYILIVSSFSIKTAIRQKKFFLELGLICLLYFFWRGWILKAINPFNLTAHLQMFFFSRVFLGYLTVFALIVFGEFLTRGKMTSWLKEQKKACFFLLSAIGIVFLPTAYTPTQERQLYLPSVFFVLFFTGFLASVWQKLLKLKILKIVLFSVTVLFVAGSCALLLEKNEKWRMAGIYAEQIVSELKEKIQEIPLLQTIYIVNIPDSVEGVYLYRTHLKKAIEFRLGKEISEVVVTPQIIGLSAEAEKISPRTLLLESIQGFVLFPAKFDSEGKRVVQNPFYTATEIDKKTLQVEFLNEDFDFQKSIIFKQTDGKIERL